MYTYVRTYIFFYLFISTVVWFNFLFEKDGFLTRNEQRQICTEISTYVCGYIISIVVRT